MITFKNESFFWSRDGKEFYLDFDYGEDDHGRSCSMMCTYIPERDEITFEFGYSDGTISPATLFVQEKELFSLATMLKAFASSHKHRNTYYWLDDFTFCMEMPGGSDEDGEYKYVCECQIDTGKFIFEKMYDHETIPADFTEEQKCTIRKDMIQKMREMDE